MNSRIRSVAFIAVASLATMPVSALAQSDTSQQSFAITGNVPLLCAGGTLTGDGSFDMGVLTDTTTGLLKTDLSAPAQVLTGSFCSSQTTITISATPMIAQNFAATPPAGFSKTVNYQATASGWTTTAATFDTATTSNPAASQTRNTAFTGDISVSLSNFSTGGGATLRPVADTSYLGTVTVTLTAAS